MKFKLIYTVIEYSGQWGAIAMATSHAMLINLHLLNELKTIHL
jgi:hypothetical protein